ncbi:hypothetical protein MHU86_3782 [Fragilaria crotonensis]|nr:hypothetical protein MHU86_3782 [Fragilaria crotonensis]
MTAMPMTATATAMNLSYDDMNLTRDGSVMTEERIREERRRRGFCTECRRNGEPPVLLFSVKKNRFNPLWSSQEPLTVKGESLDGKCLKCHPELDPDRHRRPGNRQHTTHAPRPKTTAANHTSPPLPYSAMDPRTAHPEPREQRDRRLAQRQTERSPLVEQSQDQGHGDRNQAENTDQIIIAHARWAQNGAITSVSSPNLDYNASQEFPPAPLNAPSSEQPRPRPMFNLHAAVAAIPMPPISGADELWATSENNGASYTLHNSDRLAVALQVNDGIPRSPSSSSEHDADHPDQDGRPMWQSFEANFMPPPSDSSPVPYQHIRAADAMMNDNNDIFYPATIADHHDSTGSASSDSASRLMSVSTSASSRSRLIPTDTLNDRLARNLEVPPDDDQFLNVCAEASASPHGRSSPPPTPANEQVIVEDLRSLIRDVHHSGNHEFTVEILLGAMKGHPLCPRVQQFCLATIWDLGKDNDQFRASVMSSSAPGVILLCMEQNLNNAAIQEQACGALWALSINEANRGIIIQAGATARVIKCIADHKNNESVIRAAMGWLRTLSTETEVRVSTAALDGVKHVCAAMRTNRSVASIQVDGCAFLSNVAVDLDQELVALATDEEIEVIVGAIVAHPTDPMVTSGACFALKNYAYDERNLRKLMQVADIVSTLQGVAIQEGGHGSRCFAAGLLDSFDAFVGEEAILEEHVMTSLEESIVSTLHSESSVRHVLGVLEEYDWSTKVTATGLRCLVTMISETPSNRHLITEEILTNVVETMTKMMHDVSVIAQGCEFLELFAREKVNLRSAIINAGACTTILQAMMLDVHDIVLQRAATGVLRFLSRDWEACVQIQKHGEHSLNSVLAVCSEDPTVYQNVSAIMENVLDMLDSSFG